MYKNSLYLTSGTRQNGSVSNILITAGQLQISWDEILGWIIYQHFQICRDILLVCVHGKWAISSGWYIGWETDIDCLYNPFIQKEVKKKPSRYQINLFIYKLSRFVKLACLTDITWEESSIVIEVIRTGFFYEIYFKCKKHKQKHLSNIQPDISKKKKTQTKTSK